MPRNPDPKYETVLRETQRRVERPARDADLVAILRGMRALDHRDGELERIEGVLSRATRRVKGMRKRLTEERGQLGAASDRETVERLLPCEVVHDARQGGVIFVRIKGTSDVIAGSERPVSSDERNVIAKLQSDPPSDKDDEKLAAKLNLSEYMADTEPSDVQEQVDAALNASCLPDELQEALLALEQEDEPPPPKEKKAKAKAPKASAEKPKAKGRGKKAAPMPPPEPTAPAAEEPEPGPAEMERDQPDVPRPPTPRPSGAEPQPPLDDEPIAPASDEDAPAEDGAEPSDEDALAEEASKASDGVDVPAEDEHVETEATSGEEPVDAAEPSEPEAYPGAFDADSDGDEGEEAWDLPGDPPPAAPEITDDLTVVRPGVVDEAPAAPPAVPPTPAPAEQPVAAAPAPEPPVDPVPPAKSKKKAAPAPKDGAAKVGVAPSTGAIDQAAPARAAAVAATAAPPVAPPPPPAPPAAPALTVDNHFGLAPPIAKKFGEALLHFLKEPMCASSAGKTLETRLGQILTPQMRDAVIPMLHHMAGAGQVERKSAGDDFIFYRKEQGPGIDAWYAKYKRANA